MQNYASLQETHDQDEEEGVLFHKPEPTTSRWNHVEDLDSFFSRMYKYHQKHGFLCMFLQELFELNQFVFVVSITTYLLYGVDYSVLFKYTPPRSGNFTKVTLYDVILPVSDCVSNFTKLTWFILTIAMAVWVLKLLKGIYHMVYFWDIKQFFNTALGVQDYDLDNLTWHEVQTQIKAVQLEQQMCIHKRELTELDIYHRILRQENYFVAMVNKRLFPPRFNLPFTGEIVYWTKCLKYNIQWLLFWSPWSAFENPWHLRDEYKRQSLRHELAAQLSKNITWLALANLVLSPVVLLWQILYAFFYYAELIKREPGAIGIRTWSLYAQLYLRHFNELDHELNARLTRAYRPASRYLSSFSSPLGTLLAQHIGFMCGAVLAVIVLLTLYDEDVITVEHILTIMTGLAAAMSICRSIIPDETVPWCPQALLTAVMMHTHYLPAEWQDHAHTSKIRRQFQQLFQYRMAGLLEELFSPIITPYVLWTYVRPRSLDIVDFFRNFTVSVVGVGDVCSFAEMDVKKHGNVMWQADEDEEDEVQPGAVDQYTQAEDGKVELSLMHFTITNPDWVPPPELATFVDTVQVESNNPGIRSTVQISYPRESLSSFRNDYIESDLEMYPSATARRATMRRSTVWAAEGADMFAPLDMTASAMCLHERAHRRYDRYTKSYEETTPLLSMRP